MKTLDSAGWRLHGLRHGACTLLLLVQVSGAAQGAVSSRDWKTPGDGLLTYDDVNQREWLDLSQTALDVLPGANFSAKRAYLQSQFGVGGAFEGFRFATSGEFLGLSAAAGIDPAHLYDDFNNAKANSLINLLEATYRSGDTAMSIGYLNELGRRGPSSPLLQMGGFVLAFPTGDHLSGASLVYGSDDFYGSGSPGFYILRSVPEPAGLRLLLLVILATGAIR